MKLKCTCIPRKKNKKKPGELHLGSSNNLSSPKTEKNTSKKVPDTINNSYNVVPRKQDEHKIEPRCNQTPITDNNTTDSSYPDNRSSICSSVGTIVGFNNPQGYCFLNSVVQLLRSCRHFNKALLIYHKENSVNLDTTQISAKQKFLNDFCTLMFNLKKRKDINSVLSSIQAYFSSSSTGDDVNKCFMEILNVINSVSRKPIQGERPTNTAKSRFNAFKNANSGFVFDNFYGQMMYRTSCVHCDDVVINNFQLFNSLPLPVPESRKPVTLIECIKLFGESSPFFMDIPMICKCDKTTTNCALTTEITDSPRYLFIYLDRGSHYGATKNPTFVTSDEILNLRITSGENIKYRLISVIDHIGTDDCGHYYCKCNYESESWWILNDTQSTKMNCGFQGIVTNNTIVFLFKRF